MLTLLKNIECYCPEYIGQKDILIACDKIYKIMQPGEIKENSLIEKIVPCEGLYAFPGLIDQHVHIIGGGGEQGFASRVSEIDIKDIIETGITTVVGLLGADGCTRSLECLYAKAKALEIQGITTYIYSGCYAVPAINFTGNIVRDLVLVDKVIGAGEIAISDHRSSQPNLNEIMRLCAFTHLGGLISGKTGVVHLHVGDGRKGLNPLIEIIKESDLPLDQFVPTHMNRNPALFRQAIDYCRAGGNIDLTAGEKIGIPVPKALEMLTNEGISLSRVTISSDANGSIPSGGSAKIQVLYDDLKECLKVGFTKEQVLSLVTENVAKILHLYPNKGVLKENSDADILITDQSYQIKKLFAMGKLLLNYDDPQFSIKPN